ncbi:MAG: hypothetical protein ACOCP8_02280 [archaeon]
MNDSIKNTENKKEMNVEDYLRQIDKTIQGELKKIPDDILKSIMDKSFNDAKDLFKSHKNEDFKQLTYSLYRSYILGMLLEKARNKVNKRPEVKVKDNVIRLIR